MNEQVVEYLDSLALTESLRFRMEVLIARCERILGEEAATAFASEYVSEDVGRVFESIFVFTPLLLMEAQIAEDPADQLDLVPLSKSVRHWILSAAKYDLRTATEHSRLSMDVWLADNRVATMRASGRNCDALLEVGLKYVRPNVA